MFSMTGSSRSSAATHRVMSSCSSSSDGASFCETSDQSGTWRWSGAVMGAGGAVAVAVGCGCGGAGGHHAQGQVEGAAREEAVERLARRLVRAHDHVLKRERRARRT